jgi:hypothetical protein
MLSALENDIGLPNQHACFWPIKPFNRLVATLVQARLCHQQTPLQQTQQPCMARSTKTNA